MVTSAHSQLCQETSASVQQGTFLGLPLEIQQQIFSHVYSPWHFRFTHEHDSIADTDEPVLERTLAHVRDSLPGNSIYAPLPSLAPLLVCRSFHDVARPFLLSSLTGHVHIASRLIWKEVHPKYAAIFTQVSDLTILRPHVSSFLKLDFGRYFSNLTRVRVWCEVGWWGWDRPPALLPKSLMEDTYASIAQIEAEVFETPSIWDAWFLKWIKEALWATSLSATFVAFAESSKCPKTRKGAELIVVKPFAWGRDMNLTTRSNFRAKRWMEQPDLRPSFKPNILWARSVVVEYRYVGWEECVSGKYEMVGKRVMLDEKLIAKGHHAGEVEDVLEWNV